MPLPKSKNVEILMRKRWKIINIGFAIMFAIFIIINLFATVLPLGFLFVMWALVNICNLLFDILKYKSFVLMGSEGVPDLSVEFFRRNGRASKYPWHLLLALICLLADLLFWGGVLYVGLGFIIKLNF